MSMRWPLPVFSRWNSAAESAKAPRHAGGVVDRRRAELDRMHVLGAGHRHDAGGGLDDVIVGGLLAARPVLAERRERRVDQPRIDRGQRLVTKPQGFERAGAVVLDEHVGGRDQLLQNLAVGLAP